MTEEKQKSIKDFFLSFSIMLCGVGLLFIGSVSFVPTSTITSNTVATFPQSAPRQNLLVGGDVTPTVLPVSHPLVPLAKLDKKEFEQPLTAAAALVVDNHTDTELFSQNADVARPLASITKLMSMLVILERRLDWNAKTTITADEIEGSHIVEAGEVYTAEELWNLALVGSANGAVNALVRLSSYTRSEFVARMNTKAKIWRLDSMNFVEPTGLDSGNVGNTRDVARLLKFALREDKIYRTLQIPEYYARPEGAAKARRVWSTDWLLTGWVQNKFDTEQMAGKTGYITDSNYNFTVKLGDAEGRAVRVVILGATNHEARFTEARDLAVWAFANFLWPEDSGYGELVE